MHTYIHTRMHAYIHGYVYAHAHARKICIYTCALNPPPLCIHALCLNCAGWCTCPYKPFQSPLPPFVVSEYTTSSTNMFFYASINCISSTTYANNINTTTTTTVFSAVVIVTVLVAPGIPAHSALCTSPCVTMSYLQNSRYCIPVIHSG